MKIKWLPITDLPLYDDLMEKPEYFRESKGMVGEIVVMSPKEYLKLVNRMFNVYHGRTVEATNASLDDKKIRKYARLMSQGILFPMVSLEPQKGNQEGRHRALAAEMLGVKEIPVLIVTHLKED